jgi:xylulokinase
MAKDILIGTDLGTTVLKACAFESGTNRNLAQVSQRLQVTSDSTGRRELSCPAVDRALRQAFAELHRELGTKWKQVAGIGLASQGGSCILADRDTGKAHSPMLLWNDLRFMSRLPEVAARRPLSYWRELSWRDEPGWGLARILWLRDAHPEWLRPNTIYAGAGDYVLFHLTGQWRQDAGNALQEGCFNVPQRRLDAGPLALVDADLSFVAPLRQGHEKHSLSRSGARLLGLPQGIPVVGPYMDHEAGYLAAVGAAAKGQHPLQLSLGTAWVGNLALPDTVRWTNPFQLVLPSPACPGWMVCQPLLTGNVSWDWGLHNLIAGDGKAVLKTVQRIFNRALLPPDGLSCLPWFNMPNPLHAGALGGGTFFGLNASTSAPDLLRALAAAMACETRRVFEQTLHSGHVTSAILGGGASKGLMFQQLLSAALSPLPIHLLDDGDSSGARGSLYGLDPDLVHTRSKPAKAASPKLVADFDRAYEAYLKLFDRLYAHLPIGGALQFTKGLS